MKGNMEETGEKTHSPIRFGSICSGIEAASVAFNPLGWEAAWFSEIEPFPCALLAHHYPHVPNLGDMTALPARILSGEVEAPDLICGGTPCQDFSSNGKRAGLLGMRGTLSMTFAEICDAADSIRGNRGQRPTVILWENVPGVLTDRGNAFGTFLARICGEEIPLVPSGGGQWTNAGFVRGPKRSIVWRVLDAQFFRVAQRRRRVFLVASDASAGFDPAKILFEREGLRRDNPPRQKKKKAIPGMVRGHADSEGQELRAYDLQNALLGRVMPTMMTAKSGGAARATRDNIRFLMPIESERIQGFPDDYSRIESAAPKRGDPDMARYHALGNSWAVPVVRWIGERIQREFDRVENAEKISKESHL